MDAKTQQLIIIILGISLLMMIYLNYELAIITAVIGILGGFLTGKTLTEKQSESLNDIIEVIEDDE